METFADYILDEKNLASKMEIVYYLAKKEKIFFDKSVIFKTELVRLFLRFNKLDLDENLILTASLLCSCKKEENARDFVKIKEYSEIGARYLSTLGFNDKFCKVCEEVNRYSGSHPRERESDIIELGDSFGGLLLDRPERVGFKIDEAIVLLKYRNFKDQYNKYLETFIQFINMLEEINMGEFIETKVIEKLVEEYNKKKTLKDFIEYVVNEYEPSVDKLIIDRYKKLEEKIFNEEQRYENRPLFTKETTRKIMQEIAERKRKEN